MTDHTYKSAGVDRDNANSIRERIKSIVEGTHDPQVIGGIGGFGGMYQLAGHKKPVLVSSTDSVGTKVKLAIALNRYDSLGEDVVNACVNDVIVSGAKPLYFLDYIGMGKLNIDIIEPLVRSMVRACEETDCALIGGETAELPGMYQNQEFDLVGFAVGLVEKNAILDPMYVQKGDLLIGIPSSGLHTNGYSLVRHILNLDEDPSPLMEFHPELGRTLGEALLAPHRSYYPMIQSLLGLVKSMAHITGGGLIENVPRALPTGMYARFDASAWSTPPIFSILKERGNVDLEEMYRVFNMGLGLVLVCDKTLVGQVLSAVSEAIVVGEVTTLCDNRRVVI